MFGMPSIPREGQTMLNMCMEQCEGVYLMNEIERLRELSNARGEQVKRLCDEIERLREALRLERQLKDDALRAFNEARAALKEGK